jgi:prepilin-type N-terminal cleavage/methylation domain-containing protein
MKLFYNNKRGFTLIELLMVISIISLLSTVLISSLASARSKSRDATRIAALRQVANALELYYLNNNFTYPVSSPAGWVYSCPTPGTNWIKNGVDTNWSSGYITIQPHDPKEAGCVGNGSPFDPTVVAGSPTGYAYYSLDGKQYSLVARLENDTQYDIQSTCQRSIANGAYLSSSCGNPNLGWYQYTYYRDSSYK